MPIIQSLDRALRMLDLFDEQHPQLKITEISARMQLHKSTVHSLLKTLQLHGYIAQDEANGQYRLGLKLLEKGHLLAESIDIRTVARSELAKLSQETGQTVHLVIRDRKEGVYVDKMEGPKAVIRYSRVGRRIPLHSSAVGKVLLAFTHEEKLRCILEHYDYCRRTGKTIVSEQELLQELEQARTHGYAIDNEENEQGVRCAAVPVRDYPGRVVAALSVSTLVSVVDDAELHRYIELLRQAAERISRQLGWSDVQEL